MLLVNTYSESSLSDHSALRRRVTILAALKSPAGHTD
jgi:hypothetical protein